MRLACKQAHLCKFGENFGGEATNEQASRLLIFEYSAFAVYDERSYLIGQKWQVSKDYIIMTKIKTQEH